MEVAEKKRKRYQRVAEQLSGLLGKSSDPLAKMATVAAVLHHKMDRFFWTGFYFRRGKRLVVGPYQGPVACQVLDFGNGVCWAAVQQKSTIVVEDVNKFPGHVACDTRSKSEIVVPVRDKSNAIIAVLDVDSSSYANFDDIDAEWLGKITDMIYQ